MRFLWSSQRKGAATALSGGAGLPGNAQPQLQDDSLTKRKAAHFSDSESNPTKKPKDDAGSSSHAGMRRDFLASKRVDEWTADKDDLAELLGALSDFSDEFPAFQPLPANFVAALRKQPAALRKAYHSACYELHPDRHMHAPAATQTLALALLHALAVAFQAVEDEPGLVVVDELADDSKCNVM